VRRQDFDNHAAKLKQLAGQATHSKEEQDRQYFMTRTVSEDRDFLIACRHWNSTTPVIPRRFSELLPYPRMAGYGFGGGYFLVLNGVGIVVDPGYGFMQVLYNSYGYTICDIDVVFVTHDHPDHWADLANILVLKHTASRYAGSISHDPEFYLNHTVSKLGEFLFPPGYRFNTIGRSQVVPIISSDGRNAATATGVRAFHCERLCPEGNSPHAIGLHFKVAELSKNTRGLRSIAIAGDTQFPSQCKRKAGLCEFTEQDEDQFREEYDSGEPGKVGCPRGSRDIEVLAMHIGSVEPDLMKMPDKGALEFVRDEVFYAGYHLGFAGCLRMLDMVFRNDQANKLAILTEFGEELNGYRVDLAMALEGATKANPTGHPNVRVLPADLGMALQLTWEEKSEQQEPLLRCSKCLRMKESRGEGFGLMDADLFHPVSEMQIFEDLDTALVQYSCRW
jgi:glyoxylase-like metal-dependent hydrolase (beta-lactamase superfamily II)